MEKYLAGEELTIEEIRHAIRVATCAVQVRPDPLRRLVQEQGRAGAARRGDRLPAGADRRAGRSRGTCRTTTRRSTTRAVSDDAPFAALAFKIATDPFVGKLTFFRVYSGVLKSGLATCTTRTKDKRERVGRLLQMHANKREEIEEVRAGDIAAAIGLKDTRTGDTLCDEDKPIILEAMKFPMPVIDVAIEPKTKADQDKMGIALQKLAEEDPTFRVHIGRRDGPDDHLRHGRAPPGDHRRPHDARVQGRRERGPPAGGLPRDDPQARREGRREVHPPVGRQGPVRPRRDQHASRPSRVRASCSRTRSSAA